MSELISFSDLMKQADEVAKKTETYTTIGVRYVNYGSGNRVLKYELYQDHFPKTIEFGAAQDLQAAMDRIINPVEDAGVVL